MSKSSRYLLARCWMTLPSFSPHFTLFGDAGEHDGGHDFAVAVIDEFGTDERRCHRRGRARTDAFAIWTMAGEAKG